MELLAYIKLSGDYSQDTLNKLKKMKEKDKCPVGESFLNDLVSYYNFKDIRDAIDEIENDAKKDELALKNKKKMKGIFNSNDTYDKETLTGLFDKIKKKNTTEELYYLNSKDDKELKDAIENSKNVYKAIEEIEGIDDKELKDAIENSKNVYKAIEEIDDRNNKGIIKKDNKKDKKDKKKVKVSVKTDNLIDGIFDKINNIDDIINHIIFNIGDNEDKNKNLVLIFKGILEYDDEKEKVMALLKIYRKICDRNISKFGNLFTKTDISSIDDAFMIKSYAVFLDKLEKIKKSLEGKDLTKLERGLSNSLEKLFDLYGINDPDALLSAKDDETTKYLYEHIVQ
jgi:hypothetical protein